MLCKNKKVFLFKTGCFLRWHSTPGHHTAISQVIIKLSLLVSNESEAISLLFLYGPVFLKALLNLKTDFS
jgi:hypothetical protein